MGLSYQKQLERRDDIIRRRSSGQTFQEIGDAYGISRQRVKQLCTKYGVGPGPKEAPFDVDKAVELLKKGENVKSVVAMMDTSPSIFRRWLEKQGHDYNKLVEYGFAHRWDGRQFGKWTVIDGSYRRVHPENRKTSVAYVTCKCECGTIREVSTGNLSNKSSQGCGCRNSTGERKKTPWVCKSSIPYVRYETTYQLAQALGVSYQTLIRRRNREEAFIDDRGRAWFPLNDESIPMNQPTRAIRVQLLEEKNDLQSRWKAAWKRLGGRLIR